jgi:glycosyltransferase involved in cell wall biosynthesis/predicted  nucleic acid-binding Zn-ribbon protein
MKILKVVHGFPPECTGGTERHVLRLAREMVAQGHEVHILCGSQQGAGPVAADANLVHTSFEGLPVHRLHRPGLFLDNWEKSLAPEVEPLLDWLFRDMRPDIVHVHHWIRLTRNLVELAHDRGVPAVATLHDLWTTCPRAFRMREGSLCSLEMGPVNCLGCAPAGENMSDEEQRRELALFRDDLRNELELARRLIVPSVAHREVLLKQMPQLAGRFRVIPHGNVSEIRRRKPSRSSFPSGPLRIGHWGHLSHIKGFDILLEAVRTSRHRQDIELHIFGEMVYPSERARFEELAEGLAITWHGPYKPADLARVPLDLALITSRCSESWSFVLDEAFLLGLPVVVPDRGALKERIGGAGTTFLAESAPDLAASLGEIFRQPKLLDLWRSRIPELPNLGEHTRRMLTLYREVLSSEAPLPTTKQQLRNRRMLVRSWQLEGRNRRLETELGAVRNLREDLTRASKTMDEMQYYHGEKDKELARLSGEVRELREREAAIRAEATRNISDELGRRLHDIEKRERKKQRRVERLKDEMDQRSAENQRLADEMSAAEDAREQLRVELAATELRASRAEADADELRRALNVQEDALLRLHTSTSQTLLRLADSEQERSSAMDALTASSLAENPEEDALPPAMQKLRELILSRSAPELVIELKDRAHDLQQELDSVRTQLKERDEQLDQLAQSAAAAREEHAEAQQRHSEQVTLAETASASHGHSVGVLKQENSVLQAQIDTLIAERAATEEERVAQKLHLLRSEHLCTQLRTALDQTEADRAALEARVRTLADRMRTLGLRMLENVPSVSPAAASPSEARLEQMLDQILTRQAQAQALLGERDEIISRFARVTDGLVQVLETGERRRGRLAAPPARNTSGRLRILMVVHQFLPKHVAGTEIYTLRLAKELAKQHDVVILSAESDHSRQRFERSTTTVDGLKVHQFIHNYTWDGFRDTYDCPAADAIFRDVLREESPDLVHIQHLHYHSANYVTIARLRGVPVVYTLHDFMPMCPRDGQLRRADGEVCRQPVPAKCRDCIAHLSLDEHSTPLLPRALHPGADGLLPADIALLVRRGRMRVTSDDPYELAAAERLDYLRSVLRDVNLFISPSQFLADSMVESGLVPADRIIVSDNGYDLRPWKDLRRVAGEGLRITYIGTIAEHKGVHVLLEAMNAIPDVGITCRVYGDLSAFEEYSARLHALNHSSRTLLMGPLPPERVQEALARTDLLVVPSLWPENSPLTVHEAALARVPVLASRIGGLAEYVKDGVTGMLFAPGNASELRHYIHEFAAKGLPGFEPSALRVRSIEDDAKGMEENYRRLLSASKR